MTYNATEPHIIREASNGLNILSIADEMLARREIGVAGDVNQEMAYTVYQLIYHLEREDAASPITVYVSSNGGDVRAGLAIYDALRQVSCPVTTVCLDIAASMGAVIFEAGDTRRMGPHAELLVHDPLIPAGAGGSAMTVLEASRRLMDVRSVLTGILAERSGNGLEHVQELTGRETILTAQEAVEQGFADEVIASRKKAA